MKLKSQLPTKLDLFSSLLLRGEISKSNFPNEEPERICFPFCGGLSGEIGETGDRGEGGKSDMFAGGVIGAVALLVLLMLVVVVVFLVELAV